MKYIFKKEIVKFSYLNWWSKKKKFYKRHILFKLLQICVNI